MIHIIDLYSEPGVHDRVNKSLFDAVKLYDSDDVLFWGHRCLGKYHGFNTIALAVAFSSKNPLRYFVRDFLVPLFLIFSIPIKIKQGDRIVITGFSRPQIFLFGFVIRIIGKLVPVSILFHSQVEVVNQSRAKGILRLYHHILRIVMIGLLRSASLRCLVLSEHIIKNIENNISDCKSIRSMSHPFTLDDLKVTQETEKNPQHKHNSKKVVGAFGLFRDDTKKSSQIYDIASVNMSYKFKLVGRRGPEFQWQDGLTNVENIKLEEIISREAADTYLNSFDYLIYSFPPNSYKYTASGSVLDGMVLCKSIIISKNDSLCEAVKGYPNVYLIENDLLIRPYTGHTSYQSHTAFVRSRVIMPDNNELFDAFCWFLNDRS